MNSCKTQSIPCSRETTPHISKYFSPTDNQRKYLIDGIPYYSVTSILGATKAICMQNILDSWSTRLELDYGAKKAKKKRVLPTKVGSYTHLVIEYQLKNIHKPLRDFNRSIAKYFKPVLNDIDEVIAIEFPVYSTTLGFAGTVDAIVKMKDGRVLILDHKTASKKKTKSGIKDYNLQVAAYALAYHEMTGTVVDGAQINIIYRTSVGKRNPTRLDRYDVKNLRKESVAFLARLDIFKAKLVTSNW